MYAELESLRAEPVSERELQKVKNQNAASNFRSLRSNFALMIQLLIREANRGWQHINTDPALYEGVTAEDVMRVANEYFAPENRTVAVYYRKETSGEEDPLLAGLDEMERQQVAQLRGMLPQLSAEQLREMLAQFEESAAEAPEENRDLVEVVLKLIRDRLEEIGGGER